jgi:hypothetical protein
LRHFTPHTRGFEATAVTASTKTYEVHERAHLADRGGQRRHQGSDGGDDGSRGRGCTGRGGRSSKKKTAGAGQGLTLARFRAQLEDFRDTSLTIGST